MIIKEKKAYVFLSHPIFGIGGAQLYVRGKSKFLKQNGFDVFVFSGLSSGNVVVDDFKQYSDLIYPQLLNKPFIYTKKKREKVVKSISERINDYDNIVIESCDLNSGEWGELIAKRNRAKHVVFCLAEQYIKISLWDKSFLEFKHKNGSLFGITKYTLPLLLGKELPEDECHFWLAVSDNAPMKIYNEDIESIEKRDYNIGSIGRINKPYVPSMLDGISRFVKKHPEKLINVLLCVGEHEKKDEFIINSYFDGLVNVSLHIFGPLNPLPYSLFDLCDVFVSTAGCARLSLNMGVPTITLDVDDHQPIGILGYTTQNTVYRRGEVVRDLCSYLEDILVGKICAGVKFRKIEYDNDLQYKKQLEDLEKIDMIYYNFGDYKLDFKTRIQFFLMLFGEKIYGIFKSIFLKRKIN